jgi:hypothetical protein
MDLDVLTDFWFWGFCTVCKINFLTTFREPLWVQSSVVVSSRTGSSSKQYQLRGQTPTKQNMETGRPAVKKK